MDILIFSDSHGAVGNINEVMARCISPPDAVIFLGDGLRDLDRANTGDAELHCVRGNCDFGAVFEEDEEIFVLGGLKIMITHGHKYGVKSGYASLAEHAARRGADIIIFGHTHAPMLHCFSAGEQIGNTELKKPLYVFNPGSLREGRYGTLTLLGGNILFNNAEI